MKFMENEIVMDATEILYKTHSKTNRELTLLMENKAISKRNKELIIKFTEYKKFKGLSDVRILKYFNRLRLMVLKLNKNLDKVTKKDIETLVIQINNSNLSTNSKGEDLAILRLFYKWLKGNDKKYPKEVQDITIRRETKKRAPSEILTEEDIKAMLNATSSVRDKAMISLLADSGVRVGELVSVIISNLSYTDDGLIQLMIETGKTGGRRVLLIPSVPYLSTWLNHHPLKDDPKAYLFISLDKRNRYGQLSHSAVNMMLHKIAKKINLKKAVNPHAFRRYSATSSSSFMSDSLLMMRYGWTKRQTVSSYTFLNPKEADDSYRKGFGKQELKVKESQLQSVVCICKAVNAPTNDYCNNCGKPLNLKVALNLEDKRAKVDEQMNNLIEKRPEILDLLAKMIKEIDK